MIYFQVEDVNQKFEALEKQKQSNWIQVEKKGNVKTATTPTMVTTTIRKRSGQRHTASKATASSGLKALIAAKRKKVPTNHERLNIPEIVMNESEETSEAPCSPERTFNGGFFKIKTPLPNLKQASPSRLTRSAGCFRSVRRTEVSESAKRMSGLVSPFVSQLARRSLNKIESVRKSSLFDQMDEIENETNKENHSNEFWHFKKYC